MMGADTNIILRYFLGDDEAQSPVARQLIDKRCTPDQPLVVNLLVVLEVASFLEQRRKAPRPAIIAFLGTILAHPNLRVEANHVVATALDMFPRFKANFADCLISCVNRDAGLTTTMTFDKDAASPGMMTLLQ
jgi:predicted nucleic-acid-binding protein